MRTQTTSNVVFVFLGFRLDRCGLKSECTSSDDQKIQKNEADDQKIQIYYLPTIPHYFPISSPLFPIICLLFATISCPLDY